MSKKRILLVDDEPALLELIKIRLEANGYEIISASDGQQALDLARKEMPELIILDLMLPKVDGYQVCRLLKSDDKYKKIPILLFTACAQESDKESGREAGADGYIVKPFEPNSLLAKIKEFLKE
jgi:two-component system, OmpR family, alkaline phosphatase synthesis response regulator PhoP